MASGPRHSILSLFDPLSTSAPTTHTDDSDKENVDPPRAVSPLDTFLQSLHEPSHPAHRLPKMRLVDIGDMTLEDASLPLLQDEAPDDDFASDLALADDDENSTLTFKDMAKAASPSPKARITIPRTPLGDLPIEDRSILTYKSPTSARSPVFVRDTRAVPRNIDGEQHKSSVIRPNSEIPINISPPSPSSSSSLSSTALYNANTLRPRQAQSSDTNNRLSIDLHTSFQLHLQSPEVTFDLLNDKISFLNSKDGMDSFLEALEEDDDFDMELHRGVKAVEPETQTRDHDAPPQHGEDLPIDNEEASSSPDSLAKDVDLMQYSSSQMTNIGSTLLTSNPTSLDSIGDVAPPLPSVSALKIVKRPVASHAASLGSGATVRPTHSSQVSRQPPPIRPILDTTIANEKHVPSSQVPGKRVASQPTAKSSFQPRRDVGPRRILVSQAQPSSTSSSLSQSKGALDCSSGLSKGPRRIPVAPTACKGTGTDALSKSAQNPIPSNPAVSTALPKPTLKTGIPRFTSGPHAGAGRSVNTKKSAIPARRVL